MNPALEHILFEVVRTHLPAVFLLLDEEQRVLEANLHTLGLLGGRVVGAKLESLLASFQNNLQISELLRSGQETLLLNFHTCAGLLQTVECHVFAHAGGSVIPGGANQREQEMLRAELLTSNLELTNHKRELQKALREVEHLNELKDRFLAMAAHDLRHPIQVIQLITELAVLEGERTSLECRRDFEEIGAANRQMAKVVDGFLNLAVLRSGAIGLEIQQLSLPALLEETLGLLRRTAEVKGTTLQLEVVQNPPPMRLDFSKIKQVFTNLLTNAIEHGPPGQVVAVRLDRGPDQVTIEVADQGAGISPEVQARLFDAFFQGPHGKSGGEPGAGLGLYIANLVVRAHGGTLSVRSELGQGSVFTVALPIGPPDECDPA